MEGGEDLDELYDVVLFVALYNEVAKAGEGELGEGCDDGVDGHARVDCSSHGEGREGFAGAEEEVVDDGEASVEGSGDVEMGEVEEGERGRGDGVHVVGEQEGDSDAKVF